MILITIALFLIYRNYQYGVLPLIRDDIFVVKLGQEIINKTTGIRFDRHHF